MGRAARNESGADEQPGGTIAQGAHYLATLALLLLKTVKTCTLDAQRVFTETMDRMRILRCQSKWIALGPSYCSMPDKPAVSWVEPLYFR